MNTTFDHKSFTERLAEEVLEYLTTDSSHNPIVNQAFTYGVNECLKNRGFTNYSLIVYHGAPSPYPHYTLNTHKEGQTSVEMLDISEEQAVALSEGVLNIWDLVFHKKDPERYSIKSNEELGKILIEGWGWTRRLEIDAEQNLS